uniref:DUF1614 domain-containing protein n=1 Tax=candidate division WOR-3 bacterium TaxID=2052148 RepID=A0A7C2K446_UNCW3
MIFIPFGIILLLVILIFTGIFLTLWMLGLIPFAFTKLGISPQTAIFLYLFTLLGSFINIPLARQTSYTLRRNFWFVIPEVRETIVGINVGGAIIPVIVSLYLLTKINPIHCIIPVIIMALICKSMTRVIPGRGFVMPALIPPILAILLSYIFYPENPAACAYITGTLGTLIGADLLNLHNIKNLHSTFVSIGGAGVFDGIFLTGILSALLV